MAHTRVIGIDPHADSIVWAMYVDVDTGLGYTAGARRYDKNGLVEAAGAPAQLAIGHLPRRTKKVTYVKNYHANLADLTHHVIPGEPDTLVVLEDIFCRSKAGYKTLARVQGEFLYELEREVPSLGRFYDFMLDIVFATTWQSYVFNTFIPKSAQKGVDSKDKSKTCAMLILAELLSPKLPMNDILTTSDICDAVCITYYGIGFSEEK